MDILQGYLGNRKNLIAPRSIANDTVLHQERLHQLNLVFFTFLAASVFSNMVLEGPERFAEYNVVSRTPPRGHKILNRQQASK